MTTHVIGAGLAGLSAACELVAAGERVVVHESGPAAGGRCRSYLDRELGCRIDNGNHLLLSGNDAAWAFMDRVGSRATMGGPGRPLFPFVDLGTGERWMLRPNGGRVPWWVLSRARRVPGMRLSELGGLLALRRAGPEDTVADVLAPRGAGGGTLYGRLLEPLAVSALNTRAEEGSARLLAAVMEGSLGRGGRACIPAFPREGLSETFVDPAVLWLRARGAEVRTGSRVTAILRGDGTASGEAAGRGTAGGAADGRVAADESASGRTAPDGTAAGGRATALVLGGESIPLGAEDRVVLATPAPVAATLLPGLVVPDHFEAIVNLHYRCQADGGKAGFVGLVGGTAEWVFCKPGVVSVTVSAANRLAERTSEWLAATIWEEVRAALRLPPGPPPQHRVVREKRATFAATPAQERRRPGARTTVPNLVLAGDWTSTGLPATIEGAIRSGCTAARMLLDRGQPAAAQPDAA